jgi:hypothetical protein
MTPSESTSGCSGRFVEQAAGAVFGGVARCSVLLAAVDDAGSGRDGDADRVGLVFPAFVDDTPQMRFGDPVDPDVARGNPRGPDSGKGSPWVDSGDPMRRPAAGRSLTGALWRVLLRSKRSLWKAGVRCHAGPVRATKPGRNPDLHPGPKTNIISMPDRKRLHQ